MAQALLLLLIHHQYPFPRVVVAVADFPHFSPCLRVGAVVLNKVLHQVQLLRLLLAHAVVAAVTPATQCPKHKWVAVQPL